MNTQCSEIRKKQSDARWYRWQKVRIAELMRGVADGDAEQAGELALLVKSHKKGYVAVKLYESKVPPQAFAAYLDGAWSNTHAAVIRSAGSRARLSRLFEYAEFEIPETLPETVTCWRGTSHVSVTQAKRGISWSISRDVAAWFATRFADSHPRSKALLLKTTIPKSHILYYSDGRQEKEVALVRPPQVVVVDGNFEDWKRYADQHARSTRDCSV